METNRRQLLQGKKYRLSKRLDGVYLSITDTYLYFPMTLELLLSELKQRKISVDTELIGKAYAAATGENVKISDESDSIFDKTLLKMVISPDKQSAYLLVYPVLDGTKLKLDEIRSFLGTQNIKHGIKEDLFSEIVQKQDDYHEWLIAEGSPSIPGKNASIAFHFSKEGIDLKPQQLEDGSVDFYNLNLIQVVEAGTVLAEKTPPQPGINGINVFGEEKKAPAGKDIRLPAGQNTQIIENNTKLVATKQGHVVYTGNRVNVLATYEIKGDVDFNTGNIKYPGNVIVYGNVKNNFEIEASGDVEIFGTLEGSVKTEGNLQVKNGIVRGRVLASGNVFTRYIENGHVQSKMSIIVTEAVMHSDIKAVQKVTVSGKKGLLVGGSCSAGDEIKAKNIGSNLGTLTTLEVGILPEARQEYKELSKKLNTLLEDFEKNNKIIKTLQEMKQKYGELSVGKKDIFMKSSRLQYQMNQEIEELQKRKIELENMFISMEQARIIVENKLYSGITIYMGKSVYNVYDEMKKVMFFRDGIDIKFRQL